MADPLPNIDDGRAYQRAIPAHRVFWRDHWADDWEEVPYLYAEQVTQATSPEISSASLVYRYGIVARPDGPYGVYTPLDIGTARPYIRIEIDDAGVSPDYPIVWHGLILSHSLVEDGTPLQYSGQVGHEGDPPKRVASGRQLIHAVGLEWLLDREPLRYSAVSAPPADDEFTEALLGRAIAFNAGDGDAAKGLSGVLRANRSPEPGQVGAYVFAGDLSQAKMWSAWDILAYLLTYFTPVNSSGDQTLVWDFTGSDFLKWHEPILAVEGKTIKDLIDQLIDRRRLSGWWLRVDPDDQLILQVFTFNKDLISFDIETVPDGEDPKQAIPANDNQYTFDHNDRLDVASFVVHADTSPLYDRVIVRGERRGSCFTVMIGGELLDTDPVTIEADWSEDMLDQYNLGATEEAGYDDADEWGQMDRNQAARKSHTLRRVFSYFRLPKDWDGTDYQGNQVAPALDEREPGAGNIWRAGLRLENQLPLLLDHDYSGELDSEDVVPNITPEGAAPEYLPPIVGIYRKDSERWHHIDKLGASVEIEPINDVGEQAWSASVRVQADGLGFIIDIDGRPRHVIGKDEFEAADDADKKDWPADFSWKDGLFATVFMYADEHLICAYPPVREDSDEDVYETLTIEVGGSGRLDFMPAGTVWKIEAGELSKTENDFYLRDDRARLTRIAQVAYGWYQQPRQAVELVLRQITGAFVPGYLLTEFGGGDTVVETNSVVTSVTWDLVAGTTAIKTQYADIDVTSFLPSPRAAAGNAR